jgi:CopG family transcriptional regulator, nickel-responsive regulator
MGCAKSGGMKYQDETEGLRRITVSMPEDTFQALDRMTAERGFSSRSQAIAEMIRQQESRHLADLGTGVLAGTLTLVYDESKSSLLKNLTRIFREHIAEVISSQHVLLEDEHVLEVILMQGPARTLQALADELVACKGVITAHLTVTPFLLPPLHAKHQSKK